MILAILLIIVEHDEEIMEQADHIIDLGPERVLMVEN